MTFGDFEPDDAFDIEPADPEQVAMKLHRVRYREGLEGVQWHDLSDAERGQRVQVVVVLLAWLRRQGSA